MRISDRDLESCRRQGFVIIPNFLAEPERRAALEGFYRWFAPPHERWLELGKTNDTPKVGQFPWDDRGLNYVATHPDLIDAAERLTGTREVWLSYSCVSMRYPGVPAPEGFHIDQDNNTVSPLLPERAWEHPIFFICLEDVREGMAPIRMVPHGRADTDAVPMIVPAGSLCIYSLYTRHSASQFTAASGHRPAIFITMTRKDQLWDGSRQPPNPSSDAMNRFIVEATPRQREMIGFPPPGDRLWSRPFLDAMVQRYPGFDPTPYLRHHGEDEENGGVLSPAGRNVQRAS